MKISQKYFFSSLWHYIRPSAGYIVSFVILLAFLIVGSQPTFTSATDRASAVDKIVNSDFSVNMDQLSQFYFAANIANGISLPSSATMNDNYISISMLYTLTLSSTPSLERPNIIDTSHLTHDIAREYIVRDGDTMASIAAYFNLTTTQIRWSNNLVSESVKPGQKLYLPTRPGILYTIKNGDTLESIVKKYKTNYDEVLAYNDLDINEFKAGLTVILPSGELPENERPGYVPPTPKPPTPTYTNLSAYNMTRYNHHVVYDWNKGDINGSRSLNRMAAGNCTWFAWYWRRANMPANYWLPTGSLGNAINWKYTLRGQFLINNTPAYGAVVETPGHPYYGHVAVVTSVRPDGWITIQEMNLNWRNGVVTQADISPQDAAKLIYIHQHL